MPNIINVLFVEDDLIVQHAIKNRLQLDKGIHVAAQATTVKEALRFLNGLELSQWTDFVIISDIHLQQSDGVELSEIILRRNPDAVILILTVNVDAERLDYLFNIGVKGIIFKDNCNSLNDAIRQVHAGKLFITESMKNKLSINFLKKRRLKKPGLLILSVRESKVVSLMCAGHSNDEISKVMGIDLDSVYYAKYTARKKLGLKNDAQLGKAYANHFEKTQKP